MGSLSSWHAQAEGKKSTPGQFQSIIFVVVVGVVQWLRRQVVVLENVGSNPSRRVSVVISPADILLI